METTTDRMKKIKKLEQELETLSVTDEIDKDLRRYIQDEIERLLAIDCENYGLHFRSITPKGGYDRCSFCGSK